MNGLLRIHTNSRYSITPFTEFLLSMGFCVGFFCLSIPTLLRLFGIHCGVLSTMWTMRFKTMLCVKENINLLTNMLWGCCSRSASGAACAVWNRKGSCLFSAVCHLCKTVSGSCLLRKPPSPGINMTKRNADVELSKQCSPLVHHSGTHCHYLP